jgi:hypothetical protein
MTCLFTRQSFGTWLPVTAANASELCQILQCPGYICLALTTDTRTTDVLRHTFVHTAKRLPNISLSIRTRVSEIYRIHFQWTLRTRPDNHRLQVYWSWTTPASAGKEAVVQARVARRKHMLSLK